MSSRFLGLPVDPCDVDRTWLADQTGCCDPLVTGVSTHTHTNTHRHTHTRSLVSRIRLVRMSPLRFTHARSLLGLSRRPDRSRPKTRGAQAADSFTARGLPDVHTPALQDLSKLPRRRPHRVQVPSGLWACNSPFFPVPFCLIRSYSPHGAGHTRHSSPPPSLSTSLFSTYRFSCAFCLHVAPFVSTLFFSVRLRRRLTTRAT